MCFLNNLFTLFDELIDQYNVRSSCLLACHSERDHCHELKYNGLGILHYCLDAAIGVQGGDCGRLLHRCWGTHVRGRGGLRDPRGQPRPTAGSRQGHGLFKGATRKQS